MGGHASLGSEGCRRGWATLWVSDPAAGQPGDPPMPCLPIILPNSSEIGRKAWEFLPTQTVRQHRTPASHYR